MSRLLKAIVLLSLVGMGISIYSFLHHESFVSGTFCDLSATFNCDVVNRGPFSEIAGVPVSLLGVFGYALMALVAFLRLRDPSDKSLRALALILATGAIGFTLYLTGIEAFVLHVFCLVCLSSQLLMLGIFILTLCSFPRFSKERLGDSL